MFNVKHVWITWERQTRNRSMAKAVHAEYIEYAYKKGLLRYIVLSLKTLSFLIKRKPEIIYFQNPSVVLGLVCTLYGFFFRHVKLVGDYHNCALDESSRLFFLSKFIARHCSLVIVTNSSLEHIVAKMGGIAISFPDPLPDVGPFEGGHLQKTKDIVFVTSWANDEPINEVLSAFITSDLHNEGVSLLMTGRPRFDRLTSSQKFYNQHGIVFLGFVDEMRYWALLESAYFVIDLTTRENCMVCGAYEALAVERMLLLSGNKATTEYFGCGLTYTNNTVEDIREKLLFINSNIHNLNEQVFDVISLVVKKQSDNVQRIKSLLEITAK